MTKLSSMPRYLRTAADHLGKFVEMDAPQPIIEHAANILRERIDITMRMVNEKHDLTGLPSEPVDKPAEVSTMDSPTQEPPA